jgi:plasmid stability protein
MATFLVRLPDDELEALRTEAERQQRSMNELARDALRTAVAGESREELMRRLAARVIESDHDILKHLADV